MQVSTAKLIVATVGVAGVALAIRWGSKNLHYTASALVNVTEWIAMALFVVAYAASWLLLIVGPFRPYATFTLKGDARRRGVNVLLSLAALALLHVVLAFAVATARS